MPHPYRPARVALEHPHSTDSVAAWVNRYLSQQQEFGATAHSYQRMQTDLAQFNAWCEDRHIGSPCELSLPMLERYRRHLFVYRKANGEPLSAGSQVRLLGRIKHWCRWLVRGGHLPSNPAADLQLPRLPRKQLPQVLTGEEIESVLAQPDITTVLGLRNRALLEVLYSTAIRRMELANLTLADVSFAQRTVFVRQGKGRKDRVVPIGERGLAWVQKYLDEARPALTADLTQSTLFLSAQGVGLSLLSISCLVRRLIKRAGISKPGAAHVFRHAAATLMLENGADIRYIQEMLGHAGLGTTQMYTHVSIAKLQAIHAATHPGAKLVRRADDESDSLDDDAKREST